MDLSFLHVLILHVYRCQFLKISKKEFFSLANVTICCKLRNDFVRTWTLLHLLLINNNNAKNFLIYIQQTICMRNICVIRYG